MAKVVIGMPVSKDCQVDIRTAGYCHLEASCPDVEWRYAATRSAGTGRSQIFFHALKDPDVTHLYSMDSDTVPPTGTLQRLLKYNLPVVAGIYPLNLERGVVWSFTLDGDWWPIDKPLPSKPFEVDHIAGSTHLVKREVLESIEFPWYRDSFSSNSDGTYKNYGEDMYFSDRAKEAGWKIVVDPVIVCDHFNYTSLLSLGSNYEMVYDRNK